MKNRMILSETDKLFDIAVNALSLDEDLSKVLKVPYREVKVEVPVRDISGKLHLYHGYRIQHNGARGPYYGGIDLSKSIEYKDIIDMASRTVWKTALMNVPFGGAYGGINIDTFDVPVGLSELAVRNYTHKISTLIGPYKDIITIGDNADSKIMAHVMDEYSKKYGYSIAAVTGKPETLSGTVGRDNALVSSSYYMLDLVSKNMQMQLQGKTMALSVCPSLAYGFIDYLNYLGCSLVAINDGNGMVVNQNGFDLDDLKNHIATNNNLFDYNGGDKVPSESIISVDADILMLGLSSFVINKDNADQVNANIVVELKDAVVSMEADPILFSKGVTVVPDLMVTSGEVVVDYFEWIQNIQQFRWDYDQVNEEMAKYINESFKQVVEFTKQYQVDYRVASYMLGVSRVAEATKLRGYV